MARKKKSAVPPSPDFPVESEFIGPVIYRSEKDLIMDRLRRMKASGTGVKKKAPYYRDEYFLQMQDRPVPPRESLIKADKPEPKRSVGVAYVCDCGRDAVQGTECVCEVNPVMLRKDVKRFNERKERERRRMVRALNDPDLPKEERERITNALAMREQAAVVAKSKREAALLAKNRVRGVGRGQKRPRGLFSPTSVEQAAPGVIRRRGLKGLGAMDAGFLTNVTLGSVALVAVGAFTLYKLIQRTPTTSA